MPMDFPDFESLKRCGAMCRFREPSSIEPEADYRGQLAMHIETKYKDHVMANEIRTGKGWDKWSNADSLGLFAMCLGRKDMD